MNTENSPSKFIADSNNNNMQSLIDMIQVFKDLNITNVETEQTFMQITGYPHFENVCSNLLSFFFQTEEMHGFKDLFVKSLLECIGEDNRSYSTENVDREQVTDENKRIDIVIETEEHLIGIENKILSGVQQDLSIYETHIKKRAVRNEKIPICILLSLREETESIKGTSFHNVTYSKFLEKAKENLGPYIMEANTKWIVFLNDFIKTIEELQEETDLNKEFVEFYITYETEIHNLVNAKNDLSKSIKAKWNKFKQLIQIDEGYAVAHEDYFDKNDCSAEYWLEFDNIQIESKIVLDLTIHTRGCCIIIGIDDCTLVQKKELGKLLVDKNLIYDEWRNDECSSGWENAKDYYLLEKFSVFESEETIAQKFQEIFNIIYS